MKEQLEAQIAVVEQIRMDGINFPKDSNQHVAQLKPIPSTNTVLEPASVRAPNPIEPCAVNIPILRLKDFAALGKFLYHFNTFPITRVCCSSSDILDQDPIFRVYETHYPNADSSEA